MLKSLFVRVSFDSGLSKAFVLHLSCSDLQAALLSLLSQIPLRTLYSFINELSLTTLSLLRRTAGA